MGRASAGLLLAVAWGCGAAVRGGGVAQGDGAVPTRVIADRAGVPCCRESGYQAAVELVLRTRPEWEAAWKTLASAQPTPPLPAVDFGREMVLVVSSGTRPTGGWSITIERVERVGEALHVSVLETSPGRYCMTAQVLTHPAAAVAVPRFAGPVTFSRRSVVRDCG